MLAIGLNPSTANEDNLDPTSRNIQAIAQNNGCDGCVSKIKMLRLRYTSINFYKLWNIKLKY